MTIYIYWYLMSLFGIWTIISRYSKNSSERLWYTIIAPRGRFVLFIPILREVVLVIILLLYISDLEIGSRIALWNNKKAYEKQLKELHYCIVSGHMPTEQMIKQLDHYEDRRRFLEYKINRNN